MMIMKGMTPSPRSIVVHSAVLLLLGAAASVPLVHAVDPASVIYDQLQSIQDDIKALHETRAPSWVSAPSMRGTSDILYSCILTLFACVYTALHLNIPDRNATNFQILMTKAKWVFIALIGPEIVLWLASSQLMKARQVSEYLREKERSQSGKVAQHEPGRWKRALGVLTCASVGNRRKDVEEQYSMRTTAGPDDNVFDLKYGFFVVMGGFEIPEDDGNNLVLSHEGVKWLADRNIELVRVPRSRIMDGSKADTIQKALVLFQVGWMAMQCVARKIYGLPLCLLELHTMVHVICAVIMYAFWMEKPLDLRTPVVIDGLNGELRAQFMQENDALAERANEFKVAPLFYICRGNLPGFRISWMISYQYRFVDFYFNQRTLLLLSLALPILYSGIHLSAWNFEFPTAAEATTWKVSCIAIASGIPCYFIFWIAFFMLKSITVISRVAPRSLRILLRLTFFLMIAFRTFIVAESFISLRSVPIGVYWTPSWIQMIPHI